MIRRFAVTCLSLSLTTWTGRSDPIPSGTGDSAHGRVVFQQNCALCHSTGHDATPPTGQGPLLAGVAGRRAASLPGFAYSKALQASGIVWGTATLDHFLAAPNALVPGTVMVVAISNPKDRRDLVAFLSTLGPVAPITAPRNSVASVKRVATPGDWQNDAPGNRHRIDLAALPTPFATLSVGNGPVTVDPPAGVSLSVPAGFRIARFLTNLSGPRLLRTAPNGDIFISETREGRIRVLRTADGADAPVENRVFASGLQGPFGIAFYPAGPDPKWVYVAETNSVLRFPYHNGDLSAAGLPEVIVLPISESTGGHTTRDVAFSADGRRLYISVGSGSNVGEGLPQKSASEVHDWEAGSITGAAWGYETHRADILETDPEGKAPLTIFAAGIRNAVGIAIQPSTGVLWASTNERDGLGDDLVPDYITRVREGGFYGWPWYYMGSHEDPRHAGERPDLAGKALAPDVPVQPHSASLELTFYPEAASGPSAFPKDYRGDIFAAFHGSWNRAGRTGSKIIRVHLNHGQPDGGYEDFVTGFVVDDGHVWGRPVGVTVAHDGALLFTDDANGTLWRVSRSIPSP